MRSRSRASPFVAGLAAVLLAFPAAAATIAGTGGGERLRGTTAGDLLTGGDGDDRLAGLEGDDVLIGGRGADELLGGPGDDRLAGFDGSRDRLRCGQGRDLADADAADLVEPSCELVVRELSRDPYSGEPSQHATEVEPDSFSFGRTVVATFQVGRFRGGGATNTGWATSRDAGRTWISGLMPSLTLASRPPGTSERTSDPAVGYDAAHGIWLVVSLALTSGGTSFVVNRSRDGVRWERPVTIAAPPSPDRFAFDKEWIVCDNSLESPYRGNCYVTYGDFLNRQLSTQTSGDGGLTWSAPVGSADGVFGVGAQPVVRTNGDLVVTYIGDNELATFRSTTGGTSFTSGARIAGVRAHRPTGMRAPALPTSEVDAGGTVYVAWHDCRFRALCAANDIVISTSPDGVTWTAPRRVPIDPTGSGVDHFVPGLGVDPTTSGAGARLAIAYYSFPVAGCVRASCRLSAGIIVSRDGGASWGRPQALNARGMPLAWIAATSLGRMVGDYISTSWVAGRPVPLFSLATAPSGQSPFRQSIFAARGVTVP